MLSKGSPFPYNQIVNIHNALEYGVHFLRSLKLHPLRIVIGSLFQNTIVELPLAKRKNPKSFFDELMKQ
jgi:hypothetical protein